MSNNQVRFPVKAVATFSKTLGSYSQKLDECLNNMDNAIKALGNDWKDPKFTEFEREFKVCKDRLKPLSEELVRVKKHAEDVWTPLIQEYFKHQI